MHIAVPFRIMAQISGLLLVAKRLELINRREFLWQLLRLIFHINFLNNRLRFWTLEDLNNTLAFALHRKSV